MLSYAAEAGRTFYDRRLYLPAGWGDDPARRRDASVPEQIAFATKPRLGISIGIGILAGAVARGMPFGWVAADADYGTDRALRAFLHEHTLPYVFAVPVTLPPAGPAAKPRQPAVAQAGDLLHYANSHDRWELRSQGEGSKGQRYYDWAWFEVTNGRQSGSRPCRRRRVPPGTLERQRRTVAAEGAAVGSHSGSWTCSQCHKLTCPPSCRNVPL